MIKSISDNKFIISLVEESYYDLFIKDNVEIFVEDMARIRDAQKQLSGKKIPILISGGKYSTTNVEVMKFLAKNENMPYSKVSAYITNSISQKLLGNFYLKINKPERPTRFFNNKEDAITWLKQYI
ncbi:MAG: hypothetical protein KAZ71_02015 [Bacteroidia bacterium]|nr:hypothetical protein [Bacteroidia bacterium]